MHSCCARSTVQQKAGALCRFVAGGGTVLSMSEDMLATAALQLAAVCCGLGKPVDEAALHQLLHHCSAALHAHILALAPSRHVSADQVEAGAGQLGPVPAQLEAATAGRVGHATGVPLSAQPPQPAQQPAGDNLPQQPGQELAEQTLPESEFGWATAVISALEVHRMDEWIDAKLDRHHAEVAPNQLAAVMSLSSCLNSCAC